MVEIVDKGRFLGRSESALHLAGVRFVRSGYAAGTQLSPHAHRLPHFCFVISGAYTERIGRREFERGSGEFLFQPGGVAHEERHAAPGAHLLIEPDDSWNARVTPPSAPVSLASGETASIARRILSELEHRDEVSALALEGLVLELFAALHRSDGDRHDRTAPRWLVDIRDRLNESFAAPPALVELAGDTGRSAGHIARAFRTHFGRSIGEHCREARLQFAIRQLERTELPLAQVAAEAGFADQSHLTRAVTRRLGRSPAAHRNLCSKRS